MKKKLKEKMQFRIIYMYIRDKNQNYQTTLKGSFICCEFILMVPYTLAVTTLHSKPWYNLQLTLWKPIQQKNPPAQ